MEDTIMVSVPAITLLQPRCHCGTTRQVAWVRDFYSRSPPYPVYSDRAIHLHAFQTRGDTSPICCNLRAVSPPRTYTSHATLSRIPAVVLRRLLSGILPSDLVHLSHLSEHSTLLHFLDYPKTHAELASRLNAIFDLAFAPLEDTLTAFSDPAFTRATWPWITFGFCDAVLVQRTRWIYWRGFLLPDSGLDAYATRFTSAALTKNRYLVLFTVLWRMHVAEVARVLLTQGSDSPETPNLLHSLVLNRRYDPHYVNPNVLDEARSIDYGGRSLHGRWLRVLAQYQDTHIPLLTHMVIAGTYCDNPALLAAHYPGLADALCDDELPDMTPLLPFSGIWFEHGAKNNACSTAYAVAHFFLGKTNMQSCQTHSVIDLAYQYCNTIPNFALLFQNLLRATLCGNLAVSRNRLVLAARIRVEVALTDSLRTTVDGSNLADVPREKKKYRRRKRLEQAQAGGECGPEEPTWLPWFRKHHYVLTFLMREWHVQVACDSSEFAKIAEQHVKVRQGASLVCATNAAIRADLNRQCIRQTDPGSPLVWMAIDGGDAGGANAGGEKTIIGYAHVRSRLVFMHLRHHGFVKLLWDKSTGVAHEMAGRVSLPPGVTLDHLQFAAWCFVNTIESQVEPMGILKVLGITEGGLSLLRDMQYVYYEYKCQPSKYEHWMRGLYTHSKTDFGVLCRFLVFVRRYQKERVFYLPADEKAMHIIQQRRTVPLSPIDATTANLGATYHCRVCNAWSASVVSFANRLATSSYALALEKYAASSEPGATDQDIIHEAEKSSSHVICATACYMDPYSGDVYCKNAKVTADATDVRSLSEFRYLRDYFAADVSVGKTCSETPMRKVYLPGALHRMGTGFIGMCFFCKHVCKVKVENWTSYGITCGLHDIREHGDDHPVAVAFDSVYS